LECRGVHPGEGRGEALRQPRGERAPAREPHVPDFHAHIPFTPGGADRFTAAPPRV